MKRVKAEIKVTDVNVDIRISRIIGKLKKKHPELSDILVSAGRLTAVGKALVGYEDQIIADHQHLTDLRQGSEYR